jgi:hypothetical protein
VKSNLKKCDELWSKIVRSKGECARCGSRTKQLNSAHIISRVYRQTRWDLDNGLCLCVGCHFWNHQNPIEFTHWVEDKLGIEKVDALRKKAQVIGKVDVDEVFSYLQEAYNNSQR